MLTFSSSRRRDAIVKNPNRLRTNRVLGNGTTLVVVIVRDVASTQFGHSPHLFSVLNNHSPGYMKKLLQVLVGTNIML